MSPSTICLSKLAYVVAELKQNLPLDHAGTVPVSVNRHFLFVHQRLVRKLHQHRQSGSRSNSVGGSNWITSRKRGGRFKGFVWFLPSATTL